MKFSTLLLWLLLATSVNHPGFALPGLTETTLESERIHWESQRSDALDALETLFANFVATGNHCVDVRMDIDVEHPSCDQNDGSIKGDPSYKGTRHDDCIRYALYKYNSNGRDGEWIAKDKKSPEFHNLGPGKYSIKKYEDKNCNGGFDIDNCYQRFPQSESEFIELKRKSCPPKCQEITMKIESTDPQCGENNGSIKGDPEGGKGVCFKYALYSYTKDRWIVENASSPEFYNLAPGQYRIKKYQDADCDGRIDQNDCYQ